MIVTHIKIVYECVNCNIPYTFKFALKIVASPTDVTEHIDKTKKCTICKRAMNIKYAVLKVINASSKYGDNAIGSWQCPFCTSFVYYPQMLREVTEGTLSMITTGRILYHRYLKVATVGYPWKCPLCARLLNYKVSNYNYME